MQADRVATQAERVETAAVHAVIPAVREADRVAAMLVAIAAALVAAALAAAVVMLAASAAADTAAADIGKLLRLSSKRLVCFGRRAFFCGLKIQSKGRTASTADYCGRTSMPVTVA
jgi:Tfp pilus assembly major pilin PilA